MTQEDQLLVLISKRRVLTATDQVKAIKLCSKIKDWDYFIEKAIETNLAPLAKRGFLQINFELPENVSKFLKQYQQKIILHNVQLYQAMEDVGKVLNQHEIDFLPLKGMMLGEVVYNDISLRQISDIDLLVRKTDVETCKKLLVESGWDCKQLLWKSEEETGLHHAHPYKFSKGVAVIELHQHIHDQSVRYKIDIEEYWERSKRSFFLKDYASFLSPEDLLQHLCVHAYKHLRSTEIKISSFVDFSEVINFYGNEIDWDKLLSTSIQYDCLSEVQAILTISKKYWDANVPDSILRSYSNTDSDFIEQLFLARLNDPFGKRNTEEYGVRIFGERWKANNQGNQIKNLLNDLFPSKKFMQYRYKITNSSLVYFYYPYRWWIILQNIILFIWWKLKLFLKKKK